MSGPLSGIRVVEATFFQNGPFAGVLLADLGADVIKIEPPRGDPGRALGVSSECWPMPPYFQAQNRTKRSISLDLQTPEGRAAAHRLIATADVFLQNYRLGVAERLDLGYDELRRHNPVLIYASVTGLGQEGPQREWGVMDIAGQARSGYLMLNRSPEGEPTYVTGPGIADQVGATTMAYGILGALVHKARTGEGQALEVSQFGSMIMVQNNSLHTFLHTGAVGGRLDRQTARNPLWNTYRCGDGLWMVLCMSQADRFWPKFCEVVERPDWFADPRYATLAGRTEHAPELIAELDDHFRTRPRAEWLERLGPAGLSAGPLQDYQQLREDPQVIANGYLTEIPIDSGPPMPVVANPVRYSATPVVPPALAPEHGQHTEEVLLEIGYDWDEIGALRQAGAI
ncbi:MAG TPA: CoA transferase [Dehalococcoidia bacterium]|nr:CoA transferase [Dehalococcoidia bacterium]